MNELFVALAVAVYNIAALSGALYLVIVITQAENDLHLKKTDRPALRVARKRAFYADAAFLLITVALQKYWLLHPTTISVAIVTTGYIAGGIWILAVNSASLREREPPQSQSGFSAAPNPLRRLFAILRRH
jgi:hypothetical protein